MDSPNQVSNSDLWKAVLDLTGITLASDQLKAYNEVLSTYYSGQWCDYGWSARVEMAMTEVGCSVEDAFQLALNRDNKAITALYNPEESQA